MLEHVGAFVVPDVIMRARTTKATHYIVVVRVEPTRSTDAITRDTDHSNNNDSGALDRSANAFQIVEASGTMPSPDSET